jgi:hypothetical protein
MKFEFNNTDPVMFRWEPNRTLNFEEIAKEFGIGLEFIDKEHGIVYDGPGKYIIFVTSDECARKIKERQKGL